MWRWVREDGAGEAGVGDTLHFLNKSIGTLVCSPIIVPMDRTRLEVENIPENIVMAVYLLAHVRIVQDAPVAHHSTGDTPGAPRGEAGQEQLLLGYGREAGHDLLDHWNRAGLHSESLKEADPGQEAGHPLP